MATGSILVVGPDGTRLPATDPDTGRRPKAPRGAKFIARWRTPDGKSRMQTFARRIDAEQHLAKQAVDKSRGTYVDTRAGRTPFGEVAERWASTQPHRGSTIDAVRSILDNHVLPTFKSRPIGGITRSEVQAWVSGLPLAPVTVEVTFGKVAAIFNMAVDDGLIARSPCHTANGRRAVKLPQPDGKQVVPMTPAEVRAVIDAHPWHYRALLLLIAGTGARPGEAVGLTLDRVDFLRRTIRIDRQLSTRANEVPVHAPTKTPASVRTIPAPSDVLDALSAHLAGYPIADDCPLPGLIFRDEKGDPIRRNAMGHAWRRAVAAVNARAKRPDDVRIAPEHKGPHALRHYAASVMIDRGLSVKAVQAQLGHSSAKTTLDTYAHLWPDAEDATRSALAFGLAGVTGDAQAAQPDEARA